MHGKQTRTTFRWALIMSMAFMTVSGAAFTDSFQMGPADPDFQAWQETKGATGANFGYIPSPVDWSHLRTSGEKADSAYPARFDWRDTNSITPIKNQDVCGACWAFACCAVLESWLLINDGVTWDFSENHMKNTHGFVWDHCAGGNNDIATAYLARWSGPLNESDDPYNPSTITEPLPGAQPQKHLRGASVWVDLENGGADAHDPIKAAVMEHGPVSTAMMWSDTAFNTATSTYYYSGISVENHVVTIVGWDNDKAVPGAPGNGAWICKNSWSELFGENGYFYISYYDTRACKEAMGFYPLVDPDPLDYVYQYDPLGMTQYIGNPPSNFAYGANVFQARADETLVAVGTYALTDNTAYEIIIYNSGLVGSGFSNPVLTVSGVFEKAGYAMVTLPEGVAVSDGDSFTVRVRYETPGWQWPIPMEGPISGYAAPTAATGQSFISTNGTYFEDALNYYPNTNVCIKAFAGYVAPPEPEVYITGSPHVEIGSRVTLTGVVLNIEGDKTYAWLKDSVVIPGAQALEYVIPEVEMSHAGSYVFRVTDASSHQYSSSPFVLEVLPEGSVPVTSALSIAVLTLLMAGLGTLRGKRFVANRNR